MGKAYEGLGRAQEAEAAFALAKKFGRKDPDIKALVGYDLARALLDQGKVEEAIKEFQTAIKTSPEPAQGWREIAKIHENYGRTAEAIKAHHKVLELDPESLETVERIAQIYENEGRLEEALGFWQTVGRNKAFKDLAKERMSAIEREMLASEQERLQETAQKSSNPSEREEALLKILDMDKQDRTALENLRDFYIEMKLYKEAMKYIRRLAKADHITAWEAKRDIADLKEKEQAGD